MERPHRISAGAVIIENDHILLVRYGTAGNSGNFLVGPGGGVLSDEGTDQAVVREVREETGLAVIPGRILFVEDLLSKDYRSTKIWFLCKLNGGQLTNTAGALEEGITEARWYRRNQIENEVVFPPTLLSHDWAAFLGTTWETEYLELRIANF
jgi:8-oxo-dGTP diphosphatase